MVRTLEWRVRQISGFPSTDRCLFRSAPEAAANWTVVVNDKIVECLTHILNSGAWLQSVVLLQSKLRHVHFQRPPTWPAGRIEPRKVRKNLLVHFVRPQGDPPFAVQTRRLVFGLIPAGQMKVVQFQAIKIEPVRGEEAQLVNSTVEQYSIQSPVMRHRIPHTGSSLAAGLPRMVISAAIRKGSVLEGEQRPLQKLQDWVD